MTVYYYYAVPQTLPVATLPAPTAVDVNPLSGVSVKDYAKAGFGLGLGRKGAYAIYTLLALVFIIPGLVIIKKQHEKPKGEQSTTSKVTAIVLMVIGVSIGSGLGSGRLFSAVQKGL